jgi:hypothetical protein
MSIGWFVSPLQASIARQAGQGVAAETSLCVMHAQMPPIQMRLDRWSAGRHRAPHARPSSIDQPPCMHCNTACVCIHACPTTMNGHAWRCHMDVFGCLDQRTIRPISNRHIMFGCLAQLESLAETGHTRFCGLARS